MRYVNTEQKRFQEAYSLSVKQKTTGVYRQSARTQENDIGLHISNLIMVNFVLVFVDKGEL